jgi:hypothetical protein
MPTRVFFSIAIVFVASFLMSRLHVVWDPIFVLLIFGSLNTTKAFIPVSGVIYCAVWDNIISDSFPFYTISGLIIFGSAVCLSAYFPLVRRFLTLLMVPIYSQFLWVMLVLGYYVAEGSGTSGLGYFAPFLLGNLVMTLVLSFVFFLILTRDRRKDFSPHLLSR